MGRGDKKTRKGKIFRGSSGNTRLKVKHPTNPLSQPDPSKIGVKTDAIKKLVDAKPAPSEKRPAPAQDRKPVDKKPVDKKPADKKPTDKKTGK